MKGIRCGKIINFCQAKILLVFWGISRDNLYATFLFDKTRVYIKMYMCAKPDIIKHQVLVKVMVIYFKVVTFEVITMKYRNRIVYAISFPNMFN